MTLNIAQRRKFIDAYSKMLLTSWGDDAYRARLEAAPAAALAEAGLEIPAGATVEIVRHSASLVGEDGKITGDIDAQVDLYEQGHETGNFVFHVPDTPELDTGELDPDDLNNVAAGVTYCCCCCPSCSSCTV